VRRPAGNLERPGPRRGRAPARVSARAGTRPLVAAVRAGLEARAEPRVKAGLAVLIPGARAIGVPVPVLRAFAADLRAANKTLPLDTMADVMDALAARRVREEILLGTFWLARYGRQLEPLPWHRLAAWLPALDNWETCDQLAMGVASRVVHADLARVRELMRLTRARSEWTRRFTLATASALNQKGRAHVPETLALCAPLLDDPSANVRKAVGWALRQASRHDAGAVEAFLRAHATRAHRTVLRQGSAKLPPGRRADLLRHATRS
jgi:3-methyladenine DNA glycosylase AlkD